MKLDQAFLLPSGEKVGGGAVRKRGLAASHRTLAGWRPGDGHSPLIRLAPRATFSPEGRRR
jgi:hypothetical protein